MKKYLILRLIKYIYRDFYNILRYGPKKAPKFGQLIFINPSDVKMNCSAFDRLDSGKVLSGDWDLNTYPINKLEKYVVTKKHFADGLSWEKAGAYDLMNKLIAKNGKVDNCNSFNDIKQRYKNLDLFFEYLKNKGQWKTQSKLKNGLNYRENGGVYIHIGRNGEIISGNGGIHRLTIAKILEIKEIPAQLGVVHENYFNSGQFYNNYIKGKKQAL